MADDEYILGTDDEELARLHQQHEAWAPHARALWERAGLRPGDAVLDLGSGPGSTSFELADFVGASGRVVARDESARFLAHLERVAESRGLARVVEASEGPVETIDVPPGSLDAAYARWLFCWLEDPGLVLDRVRDALRPGGALMIQDYVDWATMKMVPTSETFDATVATCMHSWADGGVEIDVMKRLPAIALEHGFEVEHFAPVARIGGVGSPEWRWLEGFFESYLPRLVERGLLTAEGIEAWRRTWDERAEGGATWVQTPTVADLVLRKPAITRP